MSDAAPSRAAHRRSRDVLRAVLERLNLPRIPRFPLPSRHEPVRAGVLPLDVVPSVDGWRGLAVLAVVVFHCWLASGFPSLGGVLFEKVLGQGYPLLNYLFLISGFVMFLPVVRKGGEFGSVRAYAVRRVTRIVPAFYVSVVGVIVLWPIVAPKGLGTFWTWGNAETLPVHLGFLHWELLGSIPGIYGVNGLLGFGVNGAAWTLSVEAIFYALLPLVAGIYFRRPLAGLVVALIGQTLWRVGGFQLRHLLTGVDPTKGAEIVSHITLQFPAHIGSIASGMTQNDSRLDALSAASPCRFGCRSARKPATAARSRTARWS